MRPRPWFLLFGVMLAAAFGATVAAPPAGAAVITQKLLGEVTFAASGNSLDVADGDDIWIFTRYDNSGLTGVGFEEIGLGTQPGVGVLEVTIGLFTFSGDVEPDGPFLQFFDGVLGDLEMFTQSIGGLQMFDNQFTCCSPVGREVEGIYFTGVPVPAPLPLIILGLGILIAAAPVRHRRRVSAPRCAWAR